MSFPWKRFLLVCCVLPLFERHVVSEKETCASPMHAPTSKKDDIPPVCNGQSEGGDDAHLDKNALIVPKGDHHSRTNPEHYPPEGLGETIDISKDFDRSYFNQLCTNDSAIVAILAIHSAVWEFDRRKVVRETLGKECILRHCKILFVVGLSSNQSIYTELVREFKQENDILIIPKLDSYRHLSNKVYATMEWVVRYCTSPKYFIHLNDDMFVNLGYFYDYMTKQKDQNYIHCFKITGAKPFRMPKSKWFVSVDEYPYTFYPEFCLGAVYAFPNVLSKTLFAAIKEAEFCRPDDVWFTGLVRLKTNIHLRQLQSNFSQYHHIRKENLIDHTAAEDLIINKKFVFLHQIEFPEYYTLYNVSVALLLKTI